MGKRFEKTKPIYPPERVDKAQIKISIVADQAEPVIITLQSELYRMFGGYGQYEIRVRTYDEKRQLREEGFVSSGLRERDAISNHRTNLIRTAQIIIASGIDTKPFATFYKPIKGFDEKVKIEC